MAKTNGESTMAREFNELGDPDSIVHVLPTEPTLEEVFNQQTFLDFVVKARKLAINLDSDFRNGDWEEISDEYGVKCWNSPKFER